MDGTPQSVSASTLTLDVTPLTPGTTHRAAVRAVRGTELGPWVSTSFETPTIPAPAAVTGLVAELDHAHDGIDHLGRLERRR